MREPPWVKPVLTARKSLSPTHDSHAVDSSNRNVAQCKLHVGCIDSMAHKQDLGSLGAIVVTAY